MPDFAVGPSAHYSAGPVVEAYADGALDKACGNCGAAESVFCRRPDGSFKPVPCCARLRGGNAADDGSGAQRGAEGPESPSGDEA